MALDATARRRWFGGANLLVALAMVVCGETVLKERLGPSATLIYWLVCLVFTGLAILVAFLDVWALQRRIRQEQRDLFDTTLKKIQAEAETKPRQPRSSS
jgi:hypothetical protein